MKWFGKDDEQAVAFQVDFINACYQANLPVAKVIKTKSGEWQSKVKGKPLIVQDFLEGELLLNMPYTNELLENIGEVLGRIHQVSFKRAFKGKSWKEYEWDPAQFHLVAANLKQAEPYLSKERLFLVNSTVHDWQNEPESFKTLVEGIIHNDFTGLNLLVKDNRLSGVIDFGDALKSWFVVDVATALMHICLCRENPFLKAGKFLQGYLKFFRLTKQEQSVIPLLCKMRAAIIVINHKKDFGNKIPEDSRKIYEDAVRVLQLLTDEVSEKQLHRVVKLAVE